MKFTVFVAVAALCVACTFAVECKKAVGNKFYDLTKFSHIPGDRENIYHHTEDGGMLYVNFCNRTTVICKNTSSVCMLTPEYQYVSRGDVESLDLTALSCKDCGKDGVTAVFKTSKTNSSDVYTTKVHLVCKSDAESPVVDSVTGSESKDTLEMVVKTKYACASSAFVTIPSMVFILSLLLISVLLL